MTQKIMVDLPNEAKEWLVWACAKMMILDKNLDEEEIRKIRYTLFLTGGQYDQLYEVIDQAYTINDKKLSVPLTSQQASIMLAELVRLSAADVKTVGQEIQFLRVAARLLGFKEDVLHSVFDLHRKVVQLEEEENRFLQHAQRLHQR